MIRVSQNLTQTINTDKFKNYTLTNSGMVRSLKMHED